jgi:hypothetical protein
MQLMALSTADYGATKVLGSEKAKVEGECYHPPPLRPFNPAQPVGSGADRQSKTHTSVAFLTGCRRRTANQL